MPGKRFAKWYFRSTYTDWEVRILCQHNGHSWCLALRHREEGETVWLPVKEFRYFTIPSLNLRKKP